MAKFFIDRPIFAWVISIIIMLAGALSISTLPVAQYPSIAAPEIAVTATYPGASAKTIEDTVTQVIEQQMKGIDNLIYMYSNSDSSGQATVNFAFKAGTDIDIAQVQVQNKLQLAQPLLPEEVQRQGLSVTKSVKNYMHAIAFISEDGSMDESDIADYIASNIQDIVGRLPGVGDTTLFGAQYAMRIWLDPIRMDQYRLNPSDIISIVQQQNMQVTGGQVGMGPAPKGQQLNVTINAASRLKTVEEFENIFVRTNPDGSNLYLRDIAKMELNNEIFKARSRFNGKPSAGLAIKLASGANALETAAGIKKELDSLSRFYPAGFKHVYAYDTTPFVRLSISAVFQTLAEAIVLVFLVMYLFMQNFRATLIPTIAIPVVLLGTFGVLAAAGFSINSLTMFGMVLAIGLLVDDAIVVVENVERIMHEEGVGPKEAAKKSMEQITGALVGVAMVIAAVFVPMAFLGGSTGVIFRQFSITIVTAMTLSVIVAMILTPALCATMLPDKMPHRTTGFFGWFNRWFDRISLRYQSQVGHIVKRPVKCLVGFAAGLVVIGVMFMRLPAGFIPEEDQGLVFVEVQLPAGGTFERTLDVLEQVEEHFKEEEKGLVKSILAVSGVSFSGNSQNAGLAFVMLEDWAKRKDKSQKASAIAERASKKFSKIPEAAVYVYTPPAVIELGSASGFDFEIIDRAGQGHAALMQARNELLEKAARHPDLMGVRPNGLDDVDEYVLDIDMAKAGAQSLSKGEINNAIAVYWGSYYINDFLDKGRTKKVFMQAEAPYRMQASDLGKYRIRNELGEMVPFSSFVSMHMEPASPRLERYGGLPSIEILGQPAPGKSTGTAMRAMEELGKELPPGFDFDWTGISYQEKMSGSQAPMLYAISLLVVFLCLAALYESWSVPFSVLLVVPTGVIGALLGVWVRGMDNDVYFQIGLLTIIGLSAKNSILIVEFAKDLHEKGASLYDATVQAVRMRLRPIIMTSLAFILGVVPLMLSNAAGSGGQNALGTTVVWGMTAATSLGIYFTPIFYMLVTNFFASRKKNGHQKDGEADMQETENGEEHA
ncbi:efflux RND transporter permease subunit [Oxalobacter sp. OttesenSCG-928-P03]|nr:efflux RND transporter permease subunit [Oxalobacter sp. OttesenSCG-928-P03]